MSDQEKSCLTCRFWRRRELSYDSSHPEDWSGSCRAHPPSHLSAVVHLTVVDADEEYQVKHGDKMSDHAYAATIEEVVRRPDSWTQPTVYSTDWCGEWQAGAAEENA